MAALVGPDLTYGQEQCMLRGLVASDVPPESVIDGSLPDEDKALLLSVAAECIDDLSEQPAFVDAFRDAVAAGTGAVATPDAALDAYRTACETGNNQACDDLFARTTEGTESHDLARSCAGRLPESDGGRCFADLEPDPDR
ncbi:MAG: hypothetical protein R2695_06165 [Acidimicrobiales bacterium]